GIYRHVWLTKTAPLHVAHWGTCLTTPDVSSDTATVQLNVTVDNDSKADASVSLAAQIFPIDLNDQKLGEPVASISPVDLQISAGKSATVAKIAKIENPKLWGVGPHQKPNRYLALTTIQQAGRTVDSYETPFGIRMLKFDPDSGFFLNG